MDSSTEQRVGLNGDVSPVQLHCSMILKKTINNSKQATGAGKLSGSSKDNPETVGGPNKNWEKKATQICEQKQATKPNQTQLSFY